MKAKVKSVLVAREDAVGRFDGKGRDHGTLDCYFHWLRDHTVELIDVN